MGPNPGMGEFLTIHCFGHHQAMVRDLEVLVPPNFMFFSARVFLDMSQEAHIHNIIEFLGQTGAGVGTGWGGDGAGDGDEALIYTNLH